MRGQPGVLIKGRKWREEDWSAREAHADDYFFAPGVAAPCRGFRARTSMLVRQPCMAVVPYLNLASSPSVLSLSVIGWLR